MMLPSIVLLAATVAAGPAERPSPASWQDAPRRLVVIARDRADPHLARQKRLFEEARTGARERDLEWIEAIGPGPEAMRLRERLGLPDAPFLAVLVGRDGGAKLVRREPIPTEELFAEIDSMPMRRQEMRRQGDRM